MKQRFSSFFQGVLPVNSSLQKRLAINLALVLIMVMVCQWLLVSFIIRHVTQEYMVSRLAHDAGNLLANLESRPDGLLELSSEHIDAIYTQPWSGHYYQVQMQDMTLRSRSLWDAVLTFPNMDDGHRVVMGPGPRGETVLMLGRRYYKQSHHLFIIVAEDMTTFNRGVVTLQVWYAVISMVAIALLLILQRRMVRQALMQLDRAREELRRLESGELESLSLAEVPSEIVLFLTAINRLLSILTDRLEKSRHAAGNMAHAIKTPLTVLLQLTAGREMAENPELRDKMNKQVEIIRALTGRELKKVRMAGSDAPALRVDITQELLALVRVMQRVHKARPLHFEIQIPDDMSAIVDREDLLELSGNLLDNACKWAEDRVRLSVVCDVEWHLIVEDNGKGCAPEYYQQILQRGGRADGIVQGYGIGLAVVKEIVSDYGGVLTLGVSDGLGGFCARVTLPLKGLMLKDWD